MKKDKKKLKEKKIKKEVCEIFKVEKKGEEKTIKTCGTEEIQQATKKQIKEQNKILRNIFIGVGLLIILIISIILFINSVRNFEYEGVKFNVIKEGNIVFYQTSLPVIYNGEKASYNFYLRNDPRKLDQVIFDGEIILLKNMVINMTDNFNCDGDGIIAIANLAKLYEIVGAKIIRDENARCDAQGRYMFLNIQPGDTTRIEQTTPSCYDLYISNCEILKVTEKFMIETFIEINKEN